MQRSLSWGETGSILSMERWSLGETSSPASNSPSCREGESMGHCGLVLGGRIEFCSKTALKESVFCKQSCCHCEQP